MNKKQTPLGVLKDYTFITVGILLYVTSWCLFLLPNNLIGGGVSGACAIIHYATGWSMGLMNFLINAVLLVGAFFILGKGFGFRTIYAIIFSSIGFAVMPEYMPQDFITTFALNNGKMLCVIVGGAMTGLGIGLSFTHGGSTGGTDIIAMIINKYHNISPGKLLLSQDAIVLLGSLFVPSFLPDGGLMDFTTKVAVVIYAFVLVAVNSFTVDLYLTGSNQSVQIFVFSKKYNEIADEIAYTLDRGVTVLNAMGWFAKQESRVLMVVSRKTALNEILSRIKQIDPNAFISVNSAMGVYGLGFDTIKSGKSLKIK